jgi:WhiB family redox-sensing transcriptional regulator
MTWFDRAACKGMDTAIFFPGRGQPVTQAVAVCRRCEVANQCLDYCLTQPRPDGISTTPGIWGGTTSYQRDKLGVRAEWRKTA